MPVHGASRTSICSAATSWSRRCSRRGRRAGTSTCRPATGSTTRPAGCSRRGWHRIEAGPIPVVMLVREGAAIPHIAVAQSTAFMDWSKLDVEVFAVHRDEGIRPGRAAGRRTAAIDAHPPRLGVRAGVRPAGGKSDLDGASPRGGGAAVTTRPGAVPHSVWPRPRITLRARSASRLSLPARLHHRR